MGINIQNMPRPLKEVTENLDLAVSLIKNKDLEGIRKNFKANPLDVIGSAIRSSFKARPGYKLVICDLSAIENRLLGYICKADSILKVFREGLDPYKYFAVDLFGTSYEEITKQMRQDAKPAVLGCLGAGTPVLTKYGWKPIIDVKESDLVYDGSTFVHHNGTVYQGEKSIINLYGIDITPDHLILINENQWKKSTNSNTQIGQQAIDLAIGKLSNLLESKNIEDISVNVSYVIKLKKYIQRIWNSERLHPAFCVPIKKHLKNVEVFTSNLNTSREMLLTVLLTDIMLFCHAVVEQDTVHIAMQGEALLANFQMYTALFGTLSHWTDLITLLSNWIELITTETTKKGILDSSHVQIIAITKRCLDLWNGMANAFQLLDSGINIVPSIEMPEQLPEKSIKDFHRNKSLETKKTVVVPTYDILNAGPNNRFMILTNKGPLLVHNCGYALGPGEQRTTEDGDAVFTGLMKYARSMGIPLTQEIANRSVNIFREKHKEIVQNWSDLDKAAKKCIRTRKEQGVNNIILFRMVEDVLVAQLPSGRCLHYLQPKIVTQKVYTDKIRNDGPFDFFERETIEYWGNNQEKHIFGRVFIYGGKFLENFDQSIARDILVNGMKLYTKMGGHIVLHTHDEIVAEEPENSVLGIKELRECMVQLPNWGNKQLILDASGFESAVYRKDYV